MLIPLYVAILFIRAKWHKVVIYRYPLTTQIAQHQISTRQLYTKIFFFLRALALLVLIFLIAKPQLVDSNSKVHVEGIDIVLSIDVSGSMRNIDSKDDKRSRLDIAKEEAIRFIKKRDNDAIGLVIFGEDAVSRCPLTFDKSILNTIVYELEIGVIPPEGTVLSTALITAANRLKNSKAKSKIIILLTDGEPSQGDMTADVAIDAATKLGIKVYTVGIGSDEVRTMMHPFYGPIAMPGVNKDLLSKIAKETGGRFFMAQSAQDMRDIYDTIDALEKTDTEAPVFSNFWDIFVPFVYIIFGLIMLELLLSSFVWFGL